VFELTEVVGKAGTLGVKIVVVCEVGALVGNTAPLPGDDAAELPIEFVATTVAKTLSPLTRLKGAACRVAIVTEQVQLVVQLIYATLHVAAV
jgi:hypothetical protein